VCEEAVPQQGGAAQPKGLLQQMEELMEALDADLSALDADLQSAGSTGQVSAEEGKAVGCPSHRAGGRIPRHPASRSGRT
jgi:hypothetical protein